MKNITLSPFFILFLLIPFIFSCGGSGSENTAEISNPSGGYYSFPNNTSIQTSEVTLNWDPPTTNIDGTPLTDLAGYRVYFGTDSGVYVYKNDVGNSTSCTIGGLTPGFWCFAVTAYDLSGNESDYSNEVCLDIN